MTVGVLQVEFTVIDAMSLKDKRRVVKSIKDRIAHAHNVSIAEVGALDEHRRCILGIAMVANDSKYVQGGLSKLVDFIRMAPQVSLVDYQIDMLQVGLAHNKGEGGPGPHRKVSRRTERLGSTIQQELAQIIMRELNDPRLTGMPSITRVKVSQDLSIADVYVTIMGTPGQQNAALNALRHSAGLMRTRLTKSLTLRVAPFLKFHIDEQLKKELAVLELVRKAAEETAENDRRRAEAEAALSPESTAGVRDAAAPPDRPQTDAAHQSLQP